MQRAAEATCRGHTRTRDAQAHTPPPPPLPHSPLRCGRRAHAAHVGSTSAGVTRGGARGGSRRTRAASRGCVCAALHAAAAAAASTPDADAAVGVVLVDHGSRKA
jgi:hypothetical protein